MPAPRCAVAHAPPPRCALRLRIAMRSLRIGSRRARRTCALLLRTAAPATPPAHACRTALPFIHRACAAPAAARLRRSVRTRTRSRTARAARAAAPALYYLGLHNHYLVLRARTCVHTHLSAHLHCSSAAGSRFCHCMDGQQFHRRFTTVRADYTTDYRLPPILPPFSFYWSGCTFWSACLEFTCNVLRRATRNISPITVQRVKHRCLSPHACHYPRRAYGAPRRKRFAERASAHVRIASLYARIVARHD